MINVAGDTSRKPSEAIARRKTLSNLEEVRISLLGKKGS